MLKYALTFFILSIFGLPPAFAQTVTDGDRVKRADGGRLRLYGIDAPERNQPYGKEATRVLKQYMPLVAKMKRYDEDRYGCLIVELFTEDNKSINAAKNVSTE